MRYEVHYCNPLEFSIFEIKDEELRHPDNSTFSRFSDAKNHLLRLLRKDKEVIQSAINEALKIRKEELRN